MLSYMPRNIGMICGFGDPYIRVKVDNEEVENNIEAMYYGDNSVVLQDINKWMMYANNHSRLRIRLRDGCKRSYEMDFDISGKPQVQFD